MGFDEDVKLVLTAEDRASEEVQAAAKRINDEYRKMENVNKAVSRSTILNNRELFATARVLTSLGNIAGRVTDIYTKYNVMQLRIGDTAKRVTEAQEDLRRAMLENGPGSDEAIQASRRLADAQEDQKRMTEESKWAMVGFGLELATAAGSIINMIPRIQQLAFALRGLGAANAGFAMTGALANAGALAGTAGAAGAASTAGKAGMLAKFGPYAAAAVGGVVAYDHFSQPGDQTGLVDVNNPNAVGSQVNDAFANFMNFFSQNLGFGKIAATTSDLKAQTVSITINGSDPHAIGGEVARQMAIEQVAR